MSKATEWVKGHKPHTAAMVAAVAVVVCLAVAAACGAFSAGTSQQGQDEGAAQTAGKDVLDKFEGNVSANPNATDEAKQEATDADAEVDVNGQPEATTPSSSGTTDNSGSASTGNSGAGSSNTGGSGSSSQPSQPAHQHVWKNHTATKRVWVEKWVTVPDYETQTIKGAQLYTKHSDGQWYSDGVVYWFENGFTTSDLKTIIKDKVKNEGYIGNYVNRTKTERVQVGSHKEDEGHYENKTYVDYQYCDCGAKK